MFRLFAVIVVLGCIVTGSSYAQPAQDQRAIIVKAAQNFIIPHYQALALATKAEQEAWENFCAAPQEKTFSNLHDAFQQAADAWSGIEFVLYGPISVDFRFERMAHWPERRNAVSRALGDLLSRTGRDDLTPERFAQVSAAGQGLTAIERLLYEPDALRAITDGSEAAKRRCAVGSAIASSLARTSAQVLEEWQRPDGTLSKLQTGDQSVIDDAATRLATDYSTLFEIIDDQKLGAVMGKDIDDVHPTLAEDWRSRRSMRAITVNLEAADAMAHLLMDSSRDEYASVFYALRTARAMAENGPADLVSASADPKERRNLFLLRDAVHSLREVAAVAVPAGLGVTMGFNSLDGD